MTRGRGTEDFGQRVRRLREAREISLRRFAQMVELSPTYVSKIERGELPPPAEDRVKVIARVLSVDPDELLALAGRVSTDLTEIIRRRPKELASFLRTANGLSAQELERLVREAEKRRERGEGE